MTFDKIIEDGRLWSVRYDNEKDNALRNVMQQWRDAAWLTKFFTENFDDLKSYYHITDLEEAIFMTFTERKKLSCVILDISPDANLNEIFRPLENSRTGEMVLGKEKARAKKDYSHCSWLRLYALKLGDGVFVVTGGAIKLTQTMEEREHTLKELKNLELVRNFLLSNQVYDEDSFTDYLQEL